MKFCQYQTENRLRFVCSYPQTITLKHYPIKCQVAQSFVGTLKCLSIKFPLIRRRKKISQDSNNILIGMFSFGKNIIYFLSQFNLSRSLITMTLNCFLLEHLDIKHGNESLYKNNNKIGFIRLR